MSANVTERLVCACSVGSEGLTESDTCLHAVPVLVTQPALLFAEKPAVPEPLGGTVSWASAASPGRQFHLGRVPGHYLALKRHSVKVCLVRKGKRFRFKRLGGPLAWCPRHWEGWSGQPGVGEEVRRGVETDSMSLQ